MVELLAEEYPHCQFVEAGNVPESIECILNNDLDLAVLDISMPGGTGLSVVEVASAARPALPVLVVSMHPEDQYGPPAVRAGAAGYLSKEVAPSKLVEAVETLLAGGTYFSAFLRRVAAVKLATGFPQQARAKAGPAGATVASRAPTPRPV